MSGRTIGGVRWFYLGMLLLCFGASIFPIFATRTLPLYDYPNHLARMHVLADLYRSPTLQQFYTIHWTAIADLAMDAIVPPLIHVMPVEIAGKLFIALTFFLMVGGTALLHYAIHRRISCYPLVAFIFLYNLTLLFGFMNYLFSVGAWLIIFALWILWERWPLSVRLVVFACLATLLFFMHLYGLGLYGLTLVCYEASRSIDAWRRGIHPQWRDWLPTLGQFAIPAVIFLFFSPTSGVGSQTSFGDLFNKWFYWEKLTLAFDLIDNYNFFIDAVTAGLLVAGVVLALVSRRLIVGAHMMLPLAVLALVFVLMPKTVFSSWAADERLPIAFVLLAIAATDVDLRSAIVVRVTALAAAALFVLRMFAVTEAWAGFDQTYDQYRSAFALLPVGAKLTAAIAYPARPGRALRRPSLTHIGNYVIIDRDGFYPTFFAHPQSQPVLLKPPYDELAAEDANVVFGPDQLKPQYLETVRNPFAPVLLRRFDYILIVRGQDFGVPVPDNLLPIYSGPDFRLYKIPRG